MWCDYFALVSADCQTLTVYPIVRFSTAVFEKPFAFDPQCLVLVTTMYKELRPSSTISHNNVLELRPSSTLTSTMSVFYSTEIQCNCASAIMTCKLNHELDSI